MYITRESIMSALINLLISKNQRSKTITTFSRRFTTPDRIGGSAAMPYLILCKPKESYPPRAISAMPAKRTFMAELIIWIMVGQNQQDIPDTTVNNIMDFLDEALLPDKRTSAGEALTLGGLVDSCLIEGDVTLVPGDVDGNGAMHIPLKIILP